MPIYGQAGKISDREKASEKQLGKSYLKRYKDGTVWIIAVEVHGERESLI